MSVVQVKMLIEGLRKFAQLPKNRNNSETELDAEKEKEKEVVEGALRPRASAMASISTTAVNNSHIERLRTFFLEIDAATAVASSTAET